MPCIRSQCERRRGRSISVAHGAGNAGFDFFISINTQKATPHSPRLTPTPTSAKAQGGAHRPQGRVVPAGTRAAFGGHPRSGEAVQCTCVRGEAGEAAPAWCTAYRAGWDQGWGPRGADSGWRGGLGSGQCGIFFAFPRSREAA